MVIAITNPNNFDKLDSLFSANPDGLDSESYKALRRYASSKAKPKVMSPLEVMIAGNKDNKQRRYVTVETRIKMGSYVPPCNLTRFNLMVSLVSAGYNIPYHHRPQCRLCGHRYYPAYYRNYYCSECVSEYAQKISLSPTDCIELDMSYTAIMAHLGLPNNKDLYNIIDDWDEINEDECISKLKLALGEL